MAKDVLKNIFSKAEKNVKKRTGMKFFDLNEVYERYGVPGYLSFGLPDLDFLCMHNKDRTKYGIPRGRVTELHGEHSSFKSTMCYRLAAQVLKDGGRVYWIPTELDFDRDYAIEHLEELGVDHETVVDKFKIRPARTINKMFKLFQGLTEKFDEAADELEKQGKSPLNEFPPILFIIDSMASVLSGADYARLEKDFDDGKQTGARAGEMHDFFQFFLEQWARIGATMVLTNQYRANIGYGRSKRKIAHNATIRYYATLRLSLNAYNWSPLSSNNNPTRNKVEYAYGKRIYVNVYKIRGKMTVAGETELRYQFNHGFDYYRSVIQTLVMSGVAELDKKEFVIEEEDEPLSELNGVYSYRELKKKLDEEPAKCVEFAAAAMKKGPQTLEDMRGKR